MTEAVKQLKDWIDHSANIVFFGGAGVSTESGIPDFRSTDGLYHQQYDYPPETILSHSFYEDQPEEFFRFYRDKMLHLDAQPNAAHQKLAELEAAGRLRAVPSHLQPLAFQSSQHRFFFLKKKRMSCMNMMKMSMMKKRFLAL